MGCDGVTRGEVRREYLCAPEPKVAGSSPAGRTKFIRGASPLGLPYTLSRLRCALRSVPGAPERSPFSAKAARGSLAALPRVCSDGNPTLATSNAPTSVSPSKRSRPAPSRSGSQRSMESMRTLNINQIRLAEEGQLLVVVDLAPEEDFAFIYRAGMEIGWRPAERALASPAPRLGGWSYADWFG